MSYFFRAALLLVLCTTLLACGNKGPLVMPDQADKKDQSTPAKSDKTPSQDTSPTH
jgi:predicted small lipoprotein YifL